MLRKSVKRPWPWLFNFANAETNRSRSPVVSELAFLRMRTINFTVPTRVVEPSGNGGSICSLARASMLTSPGFVLACPNLPATKNFTLVPSLGTSKASVDENTPVVPLRNTRVPPPAAETLESPTLMVGVNTPAGLITRMRHGDGVQPTNRASALVLLLICNSTFIRSCLLEGCLEKTVIRGLKNNPATDDATLRSVK